MCTYPGPETSAGGPPASAPTHSYCIGIVNGCPLGGKDFLRPRAFTAGGLTLMRALRPRIASPPSSPSSPAIPAAQARALDRRQALDDQQRTFRDPATTPRPPRVRPPA